jgi:hypothetical protein
MNEEGKGQASAWRRAKSRHMSVRMAENASLLQRLLKAVNEIGEGGAERCKRPGQPRMDHPNTVNCSKQPVSSTSKSG